MISRRSMTKSGVVGLFALGGGRSLVVAAQSSDPALEYTGTVAHQNLPELPKAPDGETAIVLQSIISDELVAIVYHNATDTAVDVTKITGSAADATWVEIAEVDQGESAIGPATIEPGQYGFAVLGFDNRLPADAAVVPNLFEEQNPALVDIEILEASTSEVDAVPHAHTLVKNPHDFEVEDVDIAGIFFSPEGEIVGGFNTRVRFDLEAGDTFPQTRGSNDLVISDSFAFVSTGRKV